MDARLYQLARLLLVSPFQISGFATLLAGFTVVATLSAHAFWIKTGIEQTRDLATFFEHLGLVALLGHRRADAS